MSSDMVARFRHEVPFERALLALTDPAGEAEAVAPLSPVRARQVILEYAADEAAKNARRQFRVIPGGRTEHESGRDLLTRLGADPSRERGAMRCPAHDDRAPSLSWRLAPDGRALLHCHAGCTFGEIVAVIR